jgi:hypothetical protein
VIGPDGCERGSFRYELLGEVHAANMVTVNAFGHTRSDAQAQAIRAGIEGGKGGAK